MALLLNPDNTLLNPDGTPPKGDKFWLKITEERVQGVLVPLFGVAIPNLAGLIRNADYTIAELVVSYLYFTFIAWVIWQGNRYWLYRLRSRYSWLRRPVEKALSLLVPHTLFTMPVSILLMWFWFQFDKAPVTDWMAMLEAATIVTLCVIFITQVYEIAFLVRQWHYDRHRGEQLRTTLQLYITETHAATLELNELSGKAIRERIIVRKGVEFVSLRVEETAYFISEQKLTFLVDKEGRKYLVEKPLAELENELDANYFFRLNRKYLTHIDAIRKFRPLPKGKTGIELHPEPAEEVVVSQESGARFRSWIDR